jgi:hypothetical protein
MIPTNDRTPVLRLEPGVLPDRGVHPQRYACPFVINAAGMIGNRNNEFINIVGEIINVPKKKASHLDRPLSEVGKN